MPTPFESLPALAGYTDSPNENPLSNGGRWVSIDPSLAGLKREGGSIVPIPRGVDDWSGESLWVPQFYTDAAFSWRCTNFSFGGPIYMKLRATSDGLNSYYRGAYDGVGSNNWNIWKKIDGGSEELLGNAGVVSDGMRVNDRIGFSSLGNALALWYLPRVSLTVPRAVNSPDWQVMVSVTDDDLASGYFTLGLSGTETEVLEGYGSGVFGPELGPASPSFNVHIRTTNA